VRMEDSRPSSIRFIGINEDESKRARRVLLRARVGSVCSVYPVSADLVPPAMLQITFPRCSSSLFLDRPLMLIFFGLLPSYLCCYVGSPIECFSWSCCTFCRGAPASLHPILFACYSYSFCGVEVELSTFPVPKGSVCFEFRLPFFFFFLSSAPLYRKIFCTPIV